MIDGLVYREGLDLLENGRPFRVSGANCYYFGYVDEDVQMRILEAATSFGFNVLRIWAFLDFENAVPDESQFCFRFLRPGSRLPEPKEGPNGLGRLDRAVALAADRGIRLILVLTNYQKTGTERDYGLGGIPLYVKWFGYDDPNEFYRYPLAQEAYQAWAAELLNRPFPGREYTYAEAPEILAWELANEPRCPKPGGSQVLIEWAASMSSFVRRAGAKQLISIGDEGFFSRARAGANSAYNGSWGVDTEALLGIDDIDFGTFHLYSWMANRVDVLRFSQYWIEDHVDAAQRAAKPVLLEEFGINSEELEGWDRDAIYGEIIQMAGAAGSAGSLVWMLGAPVSVGQPYGSDGFVLFSAEDAPSLRRSV